MYIETWHKVRCPYCEKVNWICDGDTSDLTQPDIEAVRCWACKKRFVPFEQDVDSLDDDWTINSAYAVDGLKQPS